ncbi:uncharacterized protein LOC129746708 [Uranotaenia lowii]|uniref:uncharacterized protein LOC129746708 n=1 Tax=Uranotaenia lowii TaxID=190385 RepID=UPI002478EE93|nr:uncharacterized protein LOC129746708 [Uranotaenia lowii]
MNDYLQNILQSDLCDLKREFPLFESNGSIRLRNHHDSTNALSLALARNCESAQDLKIIQLEPISIKSEKKNPQVVNVKQTFRFPNNFITKKNSYHSYGQTKRPTNPRNMHSQTSKTIVELYEAERSHSDIGAIVSAKSSLACSDSDESLRTHQKRSIGGSGAKPVDMIMIKPKVHLQGGNKKKRPSSKGKYLRTIRSREQNRTFLKSPKHRSKYSLPRVESIATETDTVEDEFSSKTFTFDASDSGIPSNESLDDQCSVVGTAKMQKIIDKLQDNLWEVSLNGIRELMEAARQVDWKQHEKHITIINRKMIDFLKSPRSSLCRSACQATGELFREVKSTKRPEFDEIVDILLCKTADPNRFIQKDANIALDKLVTYIPISHCVRALSARGHTHKNPMVRIATARLLVCICALSGLDCILGTNANPRTRQAILKMLAKFLTDKNLDARKFGERLYRMLRKHKFFNEYFYKDMDNNCRSNLKRILKGL